MTRRLFNLLTFLSLGLCVLFSATWLRAWWELRELIPLVWSGGIVNIHDTYVASGVPLPLLVASTALLPIYWLVAYLLARSAARRRPGVCRTCRYDLTGNASGVCPECGTAIASKAQSR